MLKAYQVSQISPFINSLQCHAHLGADDLDALGQLQHYKLIEKYPRADIACENEDGDIVRVLVSGWGFRYKDLPDGRRQIIGFFLPGDFCSLKLHVTQPLDHSIGALTKVGFIELPASQLRRLASTRPQIARALVRHEMALGAMERQWLLSIGQRSPVERLAHLFIELHHRLDAIGLVQRHSFHLPITQTQLAEANGLSPVHVQRTLQEMRRDGLIALADRQLTICDPERLKQVAMFDARYLQLAA